MKGLILAAGRGSRLKRLTEQKPKCMYEFCGKPLLQWQYDAVKDCCGEIGVVVGYKSNQVNIKGIEKIENSIWQNSNMIWSLNCAAKWVGEDACIVSYSDILYSRSLIQKISSVGGGISLCYNTEFRELWVERLLNPLEDLESFKIKNGYITEIGKKPSSLDEIEGQYMGIIKFDSGSMSKFISYLRENYTQEQMKRLDFTTSLNKYISDGGVVKGIPSDDFWIEFDTVNDAKLYKKYENKFLKEY
ncbi:MAG: phosphocholine cytidylyltransferase family protein [Pseudobutyrivibrio sp.]|uniref:phosphocholine cytidylyltransferase family protein n=1 Tax=Pseudobutyrivibrio sp. TaxID=2014367 RepID=UPI0025DC420D|nr:phosphocholine cytidylyltransferase family protein [Pseudobutyrivibrio sp.]MBQ6462349.1 phosphocholine cytidylyltransferase family protein [Pseudobutyrivibrio sp.]